MFASIRAITNRRDIVNVVRKATKCSPTAVTRVPLFASHTFSTYNNRRSENSSDKGSDSLKNRASFSDGERRGSDLKSGRAPHQSHTNDVFSPSNVEELDTVLDIYRFAVTQLHRHNVDYGHTTTNAYEDAAFMILHELALPNDSDIRSWYAAKVTRKEKEHLMKLLRQRCVDQIPSPYLVGGCYQQGLYFMVDKRVLIPRSFIGEILFKWQKLYEDVAKRVTEKKPLLLSSASSTLAVSENAFEFDYNDYIGELIEQPPAAITSSSLPEPSTSSKTTANDDAAAAAATALSQAVTKVLPIDVTKVFTVLDMCTGSGCLAILAAKFLPNVEHVDAVDLSEDALSVADENVESHGLDEVVDLHRGDLFTALPDSRLAYYNLIISNPPYVTKADMELLPEEYRKEPKMALVAGDEGIDLIESIVQHAARYLRPDGYLLCEIGQTAEALERKYGNVFAAKRTYVVTDDVWQKVLAGSGSPVPTSTSVEEAEAEAKSVLWIDTELSKREVFLASKACLEALSHKIERTRQKKADKLSKKATSKALSVA